MEHYGTRLAMQRNSMVRGRIGEARRASAKNAACRDMERRVWDRQTERECRKALRAIRDIFRIGPR